jgi:hypothetical protein
LHELLTAIAVASGELEELVRGGVNRALARRPADRDAAAAAELEQPFVAQDAQRTQDGVASRFCTIPWPYIPYQQLWRTGERRKGMFRRAGRGTFRGHRVDWIETVYRPEGQKPSLGGDQVAYDVTTHQPLALRTIERSGRFKGRTFSYFALTLLPDLRPNGVSFVVPDGGAGRNPPNPLIAVTGQRLPAARAALGRTPLWLGRSFHGQRLRSVVVGRDGTVAQGLSGKNASAGSVRALRLRQLPGEGVRPGSAVVVRAGSTSRHDRPSASMLALARDGVLVIVTPTGSKFRVDRKTARALAQALRPVPD